MRKKIKFSFNLIIFTIVAFYFLKEGFLKNTIKFNNNIILNELIFKNPAIEKIMNSIKSLIYIAIAILIIQIVLKLFMAYNKRRKYLRSGMDIVDRFSGIEFEEFLLVNFKSLGYKGELTPKSNDYGADLILEKQGEKIVVQAKRYSGKVGISAIQEVIGAKSYYKADKSMVITNSYFTPQAINLAKTSDVQLLDRNDLMKTLSSINARKTLNTDSTNKRVEKEKDTHNCKKCGSPMVLREGKFGLFLGCSNFPKCTYTE